MAEWARLTNTTIANYMKGVEDKLTANQKLVAAIKSAGNVLYNQGGDGFKWQVEYREVPLQVNNGEQTITPKREDYLKQCSLDYIGYVVTDMMTKREKLKNQDGPWQLVNYFQDMLKRNTRNLQRQFGEELYIDSSASGNSQRMTGLESIYGTNGTVTISSGAQRSANAADVVGFPTDTYAGLSTLLGAFGSWGTQSGLGSTWPNGKGTLSYDFFSPVITCYNSTAWAGATNTWAANCVKATRYTITNMQRYDDGEGATNMKMMLLERDLYRQYLDAIDSNQRLIVESKLGLRALGFKDVIQQDGCELSWEWGIPSAVGYGLNIENVQLRSMQDTLFATRGPEFESLNNGYHVVVDFLGQLKFHTPKYFAKLMTIAS